MRTKNDPTPTSRGHIAAGIVMGIGLSLLAGCGEPASSSGEVSPEGVVRVAALSAPDGVGCVRLTFSGSRQATKDLIPDGRTETRIEGLPTGNVSLSGAAFVDTCEGDPIWISDPISLVLSAGLPVEARLIFHKNGIAVVSGDFVDESVSAFSTSDVVAAIDLGSSPLFRVEQAVTIEAFVFLHAQHPGEWREIFNQWVAAAEDKWLAVDEMGRASFGAWKGDPSDYIQATSAMPLTTNEWHHIAGVFDGSEARIYVDGSLAGSEADSGLIGNADGRAFIGANPTRSYPAFDGVIGEVRFSSQPKYTAAFTPPIHLSVAVDTVGLWRLDEGQVTTVRDASGHGLDGTVSPGASWSDVPARM